MDYFLLERSKGTSDEAFTKRLQEMKEQGWEIDFTPPDDPETYKRWICNHNWVFLRRPD